MTRWIRFLDAGSASRANLVADLAAVGAAVALSTHAGLPDGAALTQRVGAISLAIAVWMITAAALRHYDSTAFDREASDDGSLVAVLAAASATMLAFSNLLAPRALRVAPTEFLFYCLPTTVFVRFMLRLIRRRDHPVEHVLIAGTGPIGRITGRDLVDSGRVRIAGYLQFTGETDRDTGLLGRDRGVQLLGPASDLEAVFRNTPVDEVYIAGNVRKHDPEMQACIRVCERLGVPFAVPASAFRLERAQPRASHGIDDGYLHFLHAGAKPRPMWLKRLFDIVASAAALWLLLPFLLAVAALIKLTSRGPILFKQQRAGLHGRTFYMLKFRSMVSEAEEMKARLAALNEQAGPVFKMKNDPRTTRVGRFIRRYSIDELPQLINVLRGDMSIVGPRPPVPSEVGRYEAWQLRRLSVRPGLTCIWQVSGRNQISFEQWMYLDLQYIDNWTLRQDFSLIFRTVPAVLTGRGAS
jgi:exopolysaccharide biosynthesis polyprenyl glycosylphosphotransferase